MLARQPVCHVVAARGKCPIAAEARVSRGTRELILCTAQEPRLHRCPHRFAAVSIIGEPAAAQPVPSGAFSSSKPCATKASTSDPCSTKPFSSKSVAPKPCSTKPCSTQPTAPKPCSSKPVST